MHADARLPPVFRACRVSVGGSIEPILHTLRAPRPAYVAYSCSVGTRDKTASTSAIVAALVSNYTGQDTTTVDLDAPAWDIAWFV